MLVLQKHTAPIRALAYSPDGQYLASGCQDGKVWWWDLKTGKAQRIVTRHADWIRAIVISPDGKRLFSGGWDERCREIYLANRRERWSRDHLVGGVWSMASEPGGSQVVLGLGDGRVLRYRNSTKKTHEMPLPHEGPVPSVAYSANGKVLATASHDGTVAIRDPHWGRPLHSLEAYPGQWVRAVALSPDGQLMASSGDDGTVHLWSTKTGEKLSLVTRHEEAVVGLCFSPDGQRLISASWDTTVRIHSVVSRSPVVSYNWDIGRLHSLAIAPDGMTAAVGGDRPDVIVWDLEE